jgi:two-component system, sensor histidine kinase PdtaS
MAGAAPPPPAAPPHSPAAALGRLPTGAKVFLILVLFLLPLALVALFTTITSTRYADLEARERVSAIADQSAGVVRGLLADHLHQLAAAAQALERDPGDAASCARLIGTFAAQPGIRFALRDARGRLLCGEQVEPAPGPPPGPGQVRAVLNGTRLALVVGAARGGSATALYPAATLAAIARPGGFVPAYGAALVSGDDRLELRHLSAGGALGRIEKVRRDLAADGLALEMRVPGAPITTPLIVATVLVILTLFLAAAIGWFVVDLLLIRPLRRLRTSVGNYRPGEVLDLRRTGPIPAQEIRDLGETFRQITETVRAHEAELAEGLVRQKRLTREVHHRVKNNLQVISSLINFHARGARTPGASEAYASIQRRVDALAVVHRHHYAEMEENRGIDLRSVVGELAANIRATAPEPAGALGITIDIEPLAVNQDVAIAVAFLITELVELAMSCHPETQIRISVKGVPGEDRATLRVSSPALVESPGMEALLESRYARVIAGLARQLRTRLHQDTLVGAYEAVIATLGHS